MSCFQMNFKLINFVYQWPMTKDLYKVSNYSSYVFDENRVDRFMICTEGLQN